MEITIRNIFSEPPATSQEGEVFESLLRGKDFFLERIVTHRDYKQPGKWYDQEKDEWALLLNGEAILEFEGEKKVNLHHGDYLVIPAHRRHRVIWTEGSPACTWLAVHGNFNAM